MAVSNKARIWAVIGASGTGKGLWVKQQLRKLKPARFIAWDFMDEYGEFAPAFASLEALRVAMIDAMKKGRGLRARFVPRGAGEKAQRKEFEVLCDLVYAFGNCTFVAEELANVTTPGWAPAAWRKMTTSGRHCGVHIIGCTQTPALVDKTFLGNCTLVHVCAMRMEPHRVYVAQNIDAPVEKLRALQPLQWIERDYDAGLLREGYVSVPRGR